VLSWLWRRQTAGVARAYRRRLGNRRRWCGSDHGRFRIESGLVLTQIARRWFGDRVANFRRVELDSFVEIVLDYEQ